MLKNLEKIFFVINFILLCFAILLFFPWIEVTLETRYAFILLFAACLQLELMVMRRLRNKAEAQVVTSELNS